MRSLRLAIGFLTVLPIAPAGAVRMGPARAYFPLVGLALGGVLAGLDFVARLALPPIVVGALLVAALLVMTRAMHTDGFLDTCDGLFGGYSRTERLKILRDTRVGAFAVAGGVSLLLLKLTLMASIADEIRAGLLAVFPCASRFGMVSTMAAFKYAREHGLGTSFRDGRGWWQVVFGFATAAAAAGLLLGFAGLILPGAALAGSRGLGGWPARLLGGMTGDTYGAVNEAAEVVILLLGIVLFGVSTGMYQTPFW
ncbi:MAG: adenosylcobinamide-GDP ribazoletransferase [Chloroflexi bacterium]|nr:adenosylcobinamide-GDP ribazoletransferase [Chloroflexota bacterium]